VLYSTSGSSYLPQERRDRDRLESRRLLERARDHYWQAFLLEREGSWGIVQYLSLDLVSRHWKNMNAAALAPGVLAVTETRERDPASLWRLALILSTQDLSSKAPKVEWALGNLIELYVLALFPELQDARVATAADAQDRALSYARELVTRAGGDSFAVYSARRQIRRYIDWYKEVAELEAVAALADAVSKVLPETANEDWN